MDSHQTLISFIITDLADTTDLHRFFSISVSIKKRRNHRLRDFVKNNLPVLIGRCPILIDYALSELLRLKLNFQSIETLKGRRRLGYGNAISKRVNYFLQIPLNKFNHNEWSCSLAAFLFLSAIK